MLASIAAFLDRKWACTVEEHRDGTAMAIYIADGWGAFCRSNTKVRIEGHTVTRNGRNRHEFLLERRILKVPAPDGTTNTFMRVS